MSSPKPLKGWHVDRSAITYAGQDLQHPKGVLAERAGTLWVADGRGGLMRRWCYAC